MADKSIVWAWAVKNSVVVICWSVLAIWFGKWWVALFGILFLSNLKWGDDEDGK